MFVRHVCKTFIVQPQRVGILAWFAMLMLVLTLILMFYLMLILMIDEVNIHVHVGVGVGVGVCVGCTLSYTAVTCWVCFPSHSTSK